MDVAGVDGCKDGWLVLRARLGENSSSPLTLLDLRILTFAEMIDATKQCAAVGVDIPIGLLDGPVGRVADKEARQFVGRARASSVFPAPARRALVAESRLQAVALTRDAGRTGLSVYAYGIFKKVREADKIMRVRPELQETIVEVHPEVSFCALSGQPLQHNKRSPAGALRRLELISSQLEFKTEQTELEGRASFDDFLDACAAAWTAARVARGIEQRLPDGRPEYDQYGLRMEIVY